MMCTIVSTDWGREKFCLNYITTYEGNHTHFEMEPGLPNDINFNKERGRRGGGAE